MEVMRFILFTQCRTILEFCTREGMDFDMRRRTNMRTVIVEVERERKMEGRLGRADRCHSAGRRRLG